MSALTVQFDADVQAAETELPVTFIFNEKKFTGQRTAIADTLAMEDAGFIQKFDFELVVRTSAFTGQAAPVKENVIGIADALGNVTSYRVDRITPSQDGVLLTLGLCAQN